MFLTLSLNTYHFPICFWHYGIPLLLLLGCLCVRARNLWLFRFSQDFMRPISRFCTPGSILWVLEKTPRRIHGPSEEPTLASAIPSPPLAVPSGKVFPLLKDAIYSLVVSVNCWRMPFTVCYVHWIIKNALYGFLLSVNYWRIPFTVCYFQSGNYWKMPFTVCYFQPFIDWCCQKNKLSHGFDATFTRNAGTGCGTHRHASVPPLICMLNQIVSKSYAHARFHLEAETTVPIIVSLICMQTKRR